MIFFIFAACVLILYGMLCLIAIEAVWRLSVPEAFRDRVNRKRWNLITRLFGVFAIVVGVVLLVNILH